MAAKTAGKNPYQAQRKVLVESEPKVTTIVRGFIDGHEGELFPFAKREENRCLNKARSHVQSRLLTTLQSTNMKSKYFYQFCW